MPNVIAFRTVRGSSEGPCECLTSPARPLIYALVLPGHRVVPHAVHVRHTPTGAQRHNERHTMTKATPYTRTTTEGDVLTVARPEEIGADTADGKWLTLCEKHSTLVYSDTKKGAMDTRALDFCDACRNGEPASTDTVEENDAAWVELSTDEVADMSEVFAAQEEAAFEEGGSLVDGEKVVTQTAAVENVGVLPEVNENEVRILRMLEHARDAGNRAERRDLIKQARALGIAGQRVADAAGVSITYVYDVANGNVRTAPALRESQKGYQQALADIAAQIALGNDPMRWINDNRMAAAESIFAAALAEHTNAA